MALILIDLPNLDLAEETSDLKIYGKLLQACQAAAEELFREDRVNKLQRDLREMMRLVGGNLVIYFTVLHRQNYT